MPIIIPANSAAGGGFNVANSVRFDDGASSYLQKSASSGNRRTFTFSTWLKRSNLTSGTGSSYTTFFSSDVSGSNSFRFTFNDDSGSDDDKLMVYYYTGSHQLKLITNRQFRDTSAWYHIVLAVDTTQGTSTNRVKIYVNGVQETDFASSSYPSQNLQTSVNESGAPTRVGAGTSLYFDGYMSETVLLDGTAASPTSFGEFDDDSGVWKAIDVSGLTFGTNGFHLNYENSSELGTDANGGTTLAETNLTALNQSTDTCTNNFATMNFLSGSFSNNTLTEGNLLITVTSGWRWRPSTIAPSSGKWYAEFKPTSGGNIYTVPGAVPQVSWASIDGETIGTGSGGENKSVGYSYDGNVYQGNSAVYSGSSYTTNDIVGVAMDLDNFKIYFSKNGTFQNSGNPASGATGTGAVSLDSSLTDWSLSPSAAGSAMACNYGSAPYAISSGNADGNGFGNFEYAVPSGYFALCSKNLAEYG